MKKKKHKIELVDRVDKLQDRLARALACEKDDELTYYVIMLATIKFTVPYLHAFEDFTQDYSYSSEFIKEVKKRLCMMHKDNVYQVIKEKFENNQRIVDRAEEDYNEMDELVRYVEDQALQIWADNDDNDESIIS